MTWVRAQAAPKSWEGADVWRWDEYDADKEPYKCFLNPGYSRKDAHCDGIWLKKYTIPVPPKLKPQCSPPTNPTSAS